MKATIASTSAEIEVPGEGKHRIWKGVTENGVPFFLFVAWLFVPPGYDIAEFESDLGPPHANVDGLRAVIADAVEALPKDKRRKGKGNARARD